MAKNSVQSSMTAAGIMALFTHNSADQARLFAVACICFVMKSRFMFFQHFCDPIVFGAATSLSSCEDIKQLVLVETAFFMSLRDFLASRQSFSAGNASGVIEGCSSKPVTF